MQPLINYTFISFRMSHFFSILSMNLFFPYKKLPFLPFQPQLIYNFFLKELLILLKFDIYESILLYSLQIMSFILSAQSNEIQYLDQYHFLNYLIDFIVFSFKFVQPLALLLHLLLLFSIYLHINHDLFPSQYNHYINDLT